MLEEFKDFWFLTLYRMFGYIRPFPADEKLPSDDDVNKAVADIIARKDCRQFNGMHLTNRRLQTFALSFSRQAAACVTETSTIRGVATGGVTIGGEGQAMLSGILSRSVSEQRKFAVISAMRNRAAICLLATILAGCSNIDRFDIPRDPDTGQLSPESIVRRFKCELAAIVLATGNSRLRNYVDTNDFIIGAQLDLAVTDDGSLAPTFTYMQNPMFSFNTGAKYEISRAQTWTARLFFSIADIRTEARLTAPDNPYHPARCPKVETLLAGDLGVVPSVEMALNTPDLALTNTKLSGTNGVFGGSVNFMVTKNLNAVGPTYMLTHFKGPGSLAGISELNNDKITFAFAARKATDKIPASARVNTFLDTLILGQISSQLATNRSQF